MFVDYDRDAYDDALYPLPQHSKSLDVYAVPNKPLLSKLTTSSLSNASLSAQPVSPKQQGNRAAGQPGARDSEGSPVEEQQNLNVNAFSAALSCYPYGLSRYAAETGCLDSVLTRRQNCQGNREIG